MIKLVGILLIVGAMSTAGVECSSMLKRRVRSLEAMVRMLGAMETKIGTFATPLSDFFCTYRDAELDACGFCETAGGSMSFSDTVRAKAAELCLSDADVSLFCEFGSGLGGVSAAEEAKRCAYYKNECGKLLSDARESLPVKTKLLNSAGVMCGILAAVILI